MQNNKVPQTSLTSPGYIEKKDMKKLVPTVSKPPLTQEQTKSALTDLVTVDVLNNYPKLERAYVDPALTNQVYCLHSFVPSVGAKPDKDGIYGMIKFRGSFATAQDSFRRAEFLIKNVDSYHKIYTGFVGRPFPATVSDKYSKDKKKVDLKKDIQDITSKNILKHKRDERKDVQDIKNREKNLLDRQKRNADLDPFEQYITNHVKKAQLIWTYKQTEKKFAEMKDIIIETRQKIEEANKKHPEFIKKYKAKYLKARKEAGLKSEDNTFMQYLNSDAKLPF